jgi:tol-pal system protein YbgF
MLRRNSLACLILISLTGCSHFRRSSEEIPTAPATGVEVSNAPGGEEQAPVQTPELQAMQNRVQMLESQVQVLTERLSQSASPHSVAAQGVSPHPAEGRGKTPLDSDATKSYREALLLFQTRKYTEAVLGFSGFLERYADHVLAGGAQFYIAEAYLGQGELRLAEQEYQRVLTSYDRSPFVPQAMAKMASVQDRLKRTDEAQRTRSKLLSLFPNSPAAANGGVLVSEDMSTKQAAPSSQAVPADTGTTPAPALGSSLGGRLDAPPTAPATPAQGSKN